MRSILHLQQVEVEKKFMLAEGAEQRIAAILPFKVGDIPDGNIALLSSGNWTGLRGKLA